MTKNQSSKSVLPPSSSLLSPCTQQCNAAKTRCPLAFGTPHYPLPVHPACSPCPPSHSNKAQGCPPCSSYMSIVALKQSTWLPPCSTCPPCRIKTKHKAVLPVLHVHTLTKTKHVVVLPALLLHVHRLIETKHTVTPQEPIHAIRRRLSPRLRNLHVSLRCVFSRRVRDVANKNKAGRFDRLDERGCESLCVG